ncbi:hypothetical protein TELCIR_08037 [Teladorsagia circumcincta]|uniref:Uncharacterized protein n=1 Tax=Teladorsagia circumcincta TaxID=45464 RepID=A0A2G9UIP8_TELCI|nr:hypothetical protein TELCIR_08037 [Teladorsagia circumcincta]
MQLESLILNALRYPVIQPGKDRCMSCAAYKIIDDMLKWQNVGVYSTYIAAPIQYIDLTNATFDPTVWNVDYVLNGLKNSAQA